MAPEAGWARVVASLPGGERAEREAPFWRELVARWGWRRVADAGCGAGFHVGLLGGLGVEVWGFDVSPWFVPPPLRGRVSAADLAAPPLPDAAFDAVLCVGNTLSLLPGRVAQAAALGAMGGLLRPGGVLLLQWEDAGAIVAAGAVTRTRQLADGRVHLRTFVRRGRRVQMLAGVVEPGREAALEPAWLLPTDAAAVDRLAADSGLVPVAVPAPSPGAASTLWRAHRRPGRRAP